VGHLHQFVTFCVKNGENITYYWGGAGREYGFAFVLTQSDMVFRRAQEPLDDRKTTMSYWNLLIEYNSSWARERLPGEGFFAS
jgi:hypothetical protein